MVKSWRIMRNGKQVGTIPDRSFGKRNTKKEKIAMFRAYVSGRKAGGTDTASYRIDTEEGFAFDEKRNRKR